MAAQWKEGNTSHQVACLEGQNRLCPSPQVGLSKNLSPSSIIYQLEDSTEANLEGTQQVFLSVVQSPLILTLPISLERAGCSYWDGWSLEHWGHFQKIGCTSATRTN